VAILFEFDSSWKRARKHLAAATDALERQHVYRAFAPQNCQGVLALCNFACLLAFAYRDTIFLSQQETQRLISQPGMPSLLFPMRWL
jgi:hypothetical protein